MRPTLKHNPYAPTQVYKACAYWGIHPNTFRQELKHDAGVEKHQFESLLKGRSPRQWRSIIRYAHNRGVPWGIHVWAWPGIYEQLWERESPDQSLDAEEYLRACLDLRSIHRYQLTWMIERHEFGRPPRDVSFDTLLHRRGLTVAPIIGRVLKVAIQPWIRPALDV